MIRMRKIPAAVGLVVLVMATLFGCTLPPSPGGDQSGWYIKLNISDPTVAKVINVNEHDVTELRIQVFDPQDQELETCVWAAGDGSESYLIPVVQEGRHRILVTHISEENGEVVEAAESAYFNIQAMVITVIDIVPGFIGTINVNPGEVDPQEPVDLTGYWDMYVTFDGLPEMGPDPFYILQTEQSLDCSTGFIGSIDGTNVTLETWMEGMHFLIDGTLSGDEINGSFDDSPFGAGSLRLARSTLIFGRLDLEGSVEGIPISLHTDYALAGGGEVEISYNFSFNIDTGLFRGDILVNCSELSGGTVITPDEHDGGIELWDGDMYHTPWGGAVVIDTFTGDRLTGHFSLDFDQGHLEGFFDLFVNSFGGHTEVNGEWHFVPVSGVIADAYGHYNEHTYSNFDVVYVDHDLQVNLWGYVPGNMELGVPFEDGIDIRWLSDSGPGFEDARSESATLTFTRYDAEGMTGEFSANFPGGGFVTGSFDLTFQEFGIDIE